jgi:hypothetical protein
MFCANNLKKDIAINKKKNQNQNQNQNRHLKNKKNQTLGSFSWSKDGIECKKCVRSSLLKIQDK